MCCNGGIFVYLQLLQLLLEILRHILPRSQRLKFSDGQFHDALVAATVICVLMLSIALSGIWLNFFHFLSCYGSSGLVQDLDMGLGDSRALGSSPNSCSGVLRILGYLVGELVAKGSLPGLSMISSSPSSL